MLMFFHRILVPGAHDFFYFLDYIDSLEGIESIPRLKA